MMLESYELPQWILDMIEDASVGDRTRLRLYGYMLVTGIVFRTSTTDDSTGVTTIPASTINALPSDEMKELVAAYVKAAYGADEVHFFTSQKDRRISTEDRSYFHLQFQKKFDRSRKRPNQDA